MVMKIKKRNGSYEPLNIAKIFNSVTVCSKGLTQVDPKRVSNRTIAGLFDGATTRELDELSIQTAAELAIEEPEYSELAARLLSGYIRKDCESQGVYKFSDYVKLAHKQGLLNERLYSFVKANKDSIDNYVRPERNERFLYFGLKTVNDRYLSRHPESRLVIETPQYMFMRVACALGGDLSGAKRLYDALSNHNYMPSSPTLFNSGSVREQLSSCYLLDSPSDDLDAIYDRYKDIARLSKYAGGIGLAFHRIRSRGSLIEGTNGLSNGIVPWLKTLDSSVAAVNQGGRRKGAACVYLETWHADIESFLELRNNTGDEAGRTHNLNIANWVPDLFMRRVKEDSYWTLFDPKDVPQLPDLHGAAFDKAYEAAELQGLGSKKMQARDLYARMMRTLAETGNGWMTFKDPSNAKCNQAGMVHLSNLCTEILEVTDEKETAVCNLGSINLANHCTDTGVDYFALIRTVSTAVRQLDAVIDLNYYPLKGAASSNSKWRPIGLGVMGLQDVFFKMGIAFDSPKAREVSAEISQVIYLQALRTSCKLAKEKGAHPTFDQTKAAKGQLQFDLWGATPNAGKWLDTEQLRKDIARHGLRNSLLVAIAPTATIASICGVYECIEPQVSNLFKRETLSGEFIQVNKYLIQTLKQMGQWTAETRQELIRADGSVQGLSCLSDHLKAVYRTSWEIPMRSLIDMASDRGPYICQSQSLNLFMESPEIGKLSSMYMYAWKKGLKTTYYLRSRPATKIAKATLTPSAEALLCSLENPESCSACE